MKVLGWNHRDTTLHNRHAADLLAKRLTWPDDQSDQNGWRNQWASAFEVGHREVITTSKELAVRLAALAGDIRARANQLLDAETDKGPMRTMLEAFRKNLIHDLDEDGFADMFAQTICYGMLAARISRPVGIIADNLADMVPKTNPFLKELFANFLNIGGRDKRQGWISTSWASAMSWTCSTAPTWKPCCAISGTRTPRKTLSSTSTSCS